MYQKFHLFSAGSARRDSQLVVPQYVHSCYVSLDAPVDPRRLHSVHNITSENQVVQGTDAAAVAHFGEKIKLSIIVCLVDVLESISIAKALAYKHKYELV